MLKIIGLFFFLAIGSSLIGLYDAVACEIDFEVIDNKKEIYQVGDVIVVKVKVVFTHRSCPEGINATKFNYKGMKIQGATKWVETKPGTFERKLKILIEDTTKGNLVIKAIRTCDKDGGFGSIKLAVT